MLAMITNILVQYTNSAAYMFSKRLSACTACGFHQLCQERKRGASVLYVPFRDGELQGNKSLRVEDPLLEGLAQIKAGDLVVAIHHLHPVSVL